MEKQEILQKIIQMLKCSDNVDYDLKMDDDFYDDFKFGGLEMAFFLDEIQDEFNVEIDDAVCEFVKVHQLVDWLYEKLKGVL